MNHKLKSFKGWMIAEAGLATVTENEYADWIELWRLGLAHTDNLRSSLSRSSPDEKDRRRAIDLINSQNPVSKAVSMSKLITDREKLIRRSKAVVQQASMLKPEILADVFKPFADRMKAFGMSEDLIFSILQTYLSRP